jgi:hypothetical protein
VQTVARSAARKRKMTSLWHLITRCRTLWLKRVEMKKKLRIQRVTVINISIVKVLAFASIAIQRNWRNVSCPENDGTPTVLFA